MSSLCFENASPYSSHSSSNLWQISFKPLANILQVDLVMAWYICWRTNESSIRWDFRQCFMPLGHPVSWFCQVFFDFILTGDFYIISFKFWSICKCDDSVFSNVQVVNLAKVKNGMYLGLYLLLGLFTKLGRICTLGFLW